MALPFKGGARRLAKVPNTNVWTEFTPLALEHKAVNLGQGFPTFAPDEFVKQETAKVVLADEALNHQYCRSQGHLELVKWLQKRYGALLNRDISLAEIEVTNGTTQALNAAFQALIDPEDEVIVIEPYFDIYGFDIEMAAGVVKYVSLRPGGTTANEWTLDMDELHAAVGPKTKGILFNTPQNVPGKVWSRAEIEQIADFAKQHNLIVFSDEVYDRLVYDGCKHESIASLPGMYERTVIMASCGKTLSTTGWKIGWVVGPKDMLTAVHNAQTLQSFSVCTPLQIAAARSLELASTNGYFDELPQRYLARRTQLCDALTTAGLPPVVPQGSFFILADISNIDESVYVDKGTTEQLGLDWHFCRWMTKHIGVTAIPTTAFCRESSWPLYERYVRFAFCKTQEQIAEAAKRLQKLEQYRKK
jgi:kynurenine--oxoglutarate transaminase/cysteine-S-conjugate beta-lyase/glutamine--phenylpyruvate transaminase